MALSTAKMDSFTRDFAERLQERGFTVSKVQSADAQKLIINTDFAVKISAKDSVSKDIFGNDNYAFTPHDVEVHIDTANASHAELTEIMMELGSWGFALNIKEDTNAPDDSQVADANFDAVADNIKEHRLKWPTRGA